MELKTTHSYYIYLPKAPHRYEGSFDKVKVDEQGEVTLVFSVSDEDVFICPAKIADGTIKLSEKIPMRTLEHRFSNRVTKEKSAQREVNNG